MTASTIDPFPTQNLNLEPGDTLEYLTVPANEVQHNDYLRVLDHQVDVTPIDDTWTDFHPADGGHPLRLLNTGPVDVARITPATDDDTAAEH